MFDNLNNQAMLEAYYEAVSLGLDIEFIMIIKKELDERGITIHLKQELTQK